MQNQVALNKPSKKAKLVCLLINGDVMLTTYDFRSHSPYHSHARSRQLDCKLRLGESQPSSSAPGKDAHRHGTIQHDGDAIRYDTMTGRLGD